MMKNSFKRKVSWEKAAKRDMNEFEKKVREEDGGWVDKSFFFFDKAYQEHYGKDKNPMPLFRAFIEAIRHKETIKQSKEAEYCYPVPYWIIIEFYEVFKKYVDGKEKNISLDRLFGCKKGKGQSPAIKEDERRQRNLNLMTDMATLMRQGLTDADAAKVAYEHNIGSSSPNPKRIRQDYYNDGWKSEFDEVIVFPERAVRSLLKFAQEKLPKYYTPEALRKKYPNIAWGR
jgi:hypothetical protein